MDQLIYVISSIIIIAVIVVLAIIRILQSSKETNNSLLKHTSDNGTLRALAITLAVLGIIFGTERYISYSFFGASISLSIIDIIKYRRNI